MPFVATLLAFGWLAQTPALFGDPISFEPPKPGKTEYAADVKVWPGWGPLGSVFPKPFLTDGDWSWLPPAPSGASTPFRIRVILIPSVDLLHRTPGGNLDERRTSINKPCRTRIEQALALAAATLAAQSAGRLAVAYETSVDAALYEERVDQGEGFDGQALRAYVKPRINGGTFEANDKLYHGPYHLCLVIHAGITPSVQSIECGTPITSLSASVADESVSACADAVLRAFGQAADFWVNRQGHRGSAVSSDPTHVSNVFGDQDPELLSNDIRFEPVDAASYIKAIQGTPYHPKPNGDAMAQVPAALSANAELSVVADPVKGSILRAKLPGLFPNGGFALPTPPSFTSLGSFLVFDYRTNSKDPISIGPIVAGHPVYGGGTGGPAITLGNRPDSGPFVNVQPDGAWHTVALDLRQLGPNTGGLYAGYSPEARRFPKNSVVMSTFDFANFTPASAAPPNAITIEQSQGPLWDAAATEARNAVKGLGTPEANLAVAHLLESSDEQVRLNTIDALTKVKAPGLEDRIASLIGNLNPRITEAAIAALAFQDTPTAWATLSRTVSIGPGTHAKAVAAGYMASRKDPAGMGPISAIQSGSRDWHDRARIVKALGLSDIPQAWLFLTSFFEDDDPGVRLIAADQIDLADKEGMHKLMFVSVNDAADAIRAAACIKLLQSAAPEIKREGYRGTSDDSWWVRVQVLDWIAQHPSDDDRPALRQAITSPYPEVRAAALRAFAASTAPVTLDEIANTLHDPIPSVQTALIGLTKAKSLSLPPDVIAGLKASVDDKVAAAAATLGNT